MKTRKTKNANTLISQTVDYDSSTIQLDLEDAYSDFIYRHQILTLPAVNSALGSKLDTHSHFLILLGLVHHGNVRSG